MGFRCGTFPLHNLAPAEHYNASPYDTFPHGTSYIQGTLISQDEENRRVARCSVNVVEQISRLPVHAWEVGERIRIDELWHRRAVAVFRFAVVHMRDLESAGRTAVSSEQEAARRCVDVAALQASSVEQGWNQPTGSVPDTPSSSQLIWNKHHSIELLLQDRCRQHFSSHLVPGLWLS